MLDTPHKHVATPDTRALDDPPIHRPALEAGSGLAVLSGDLVARRRQRTARRGRPGLASPRLVEARLAAEQAHAQGLDQRGHLVRVRARASVRVRVRVRVRSRGRGRVRVLAGVRVRVRTTCYYSPRHKAYLAEVDNLLLLS